MAYLYSVTFCSESPDNTFQFLRLQLVADHQAEALNLATEKAAALGLIVTRLEEIEALSEPPVRGTIFSVYGQEYAI